MLSSFFINKIHIATENFNKQKTHTGLGYPTHSACLCHQQDGKLLRVLRQAAINKNSANALAAYYQKMFAPPRNVKMVPTPL